MELDLGWVCLGVRVGAHPVVFPSVQTIVSKAKVPAGVTVFRFAGNYTRMASEGELSQAKILQLVIIGDTLRRPR